MTHLLLVEDDLDLGEILKQFLEINGYKITWAKDGEEAWDLLQEESFDFGILDVMMPKMDGFSLAEKIREKDVYFPFLFLTAKNMKEDQIRGLELKADDYLAKPFDVDILLLKIQNILDKINLTKAINPKVTKINIGNYIFDFGNCELTIGDKAQKLTDKEAKLISFLVENKNNLIRREELLKEVWGEDDFFTGRSMDVFVSRVRKYFSQDESITIRSTRGIGLTFRIE